MSEFPKAIATPAHLTKLEADLRERGLEVEARLGITGFEWLLARGKGRSVYSSRKLTRKLTDEGFNAHVPHPDDSSEGYVVVYAN